VTDSGGANSILRFWLERGGDGMKHCMVTLVGGEATLGRGNEETMPIGLMRILLGQKMKKIHVIDSVTTNRW
jgi:hypothetical protein